ncbi:NepR family anti-sigma factor [Novosphingobium sediminicola]|uniref:Anti-sigma factor NepR domain-containing protein n=1 Tax=Novosphingobium sediminicola TaxID=563162 RepID=A0A7W6CI88_9SPHN|nr:hypothetical protein [Novosphingobium sediminicola]
MNREQKPRNADVTGDVVARSPGSGEDLAKAVVSDETGATPEIEAEIRDHDQKDGGCDEAPPWAAPLRDMYQQVVEEPLPDFLSDLLSRLDRDDE